MSPSDEQGKWSKRHALLHIFKSKTSKQTQHWKETVMITDLKKMFWSLKIKTHYRQKFWNEFRKD